MSKYYDINKLNTKINIMFVGDDGQVWYADGYVDYQLEEKDKEIERLNDIRNNAIEVLEAYEVHYRPGELYLKDILLDILKGEDVNE